MNTYSKFCPNVFLAKCPEPHQRGEEITVTTQYGKENECIVFNLVYQREGFFYYSIVRADGFNVQERAKLKAQKYENWAAGAEAKSEAYHKRSHDLVSGIPMGQPILVGHHSERRHRNILDKSWNALGKAVEMSEKAYQHESKAAYWESRANDINLSMPESLDYYEFELEKATAYHADLKANPAKRSHSYSLTYAKNAVKEMQKKVDLARRLWAAPDQPEAEPCGWCGATSGYSDQGDGWERCNACGGN